MTAKGAVGAGVAEPGGCTARDLGKIVARQSVQNRHVPSDHSAPASMKNAASCMN